ncbi:MAG TPA: hypothetical protein DEP04_04830 [Dehalococcoidia bacterium]|nr:hypothetical protein [Chloroflexota bacterium]HCE75933.1 hypothetical protein [Dehalococcoidia bacterium]|tara:strand:- start:2632 stop:2877 length:246 start_codon:yes stop_codon:yes gene_type:complete
MEPVDPEKYKKSLGKLETIFRSISDTASEVSSWRCPYKNVEDRCTAKFGCRNQNRRGKVTELFLCLGSDDLDYRSAWETGN